MFDQIETEEDSNKQIFTKVYPFRRFIAHLEIEKRGIRLPSSELESAEKDPDPDPDAVGEEEALAEIADRIGDAGDVGVIAEIGVGATRRGALSALELGHGVAQPLLRLAETEVGLGGGAGERRIVGRRGRSRLGEGRRHL